MGAYVFIGVGAVTMLMGFLGCLGAVNEVRCLLGLVSTPAARCWPVGWGAGGEGGGPADRPLCPQYFAFLLLLLIAQVAAGTLFYFNVGQVSARPRPGRRVVDWGPRWSRLTRSDRRQSTYCVPVASSGGLTCTALQQLWAVDTDRWGHRCSEVDGSNGDQ